MPQVERLSQAPGDGPVALILPGAGYPVRAPLLHWTRRALSHAGYDIWTITWHSEFDHTAQTDPRAFVEAQLAQTVEVLPSTPVVVIGKSLGCFALPHVVERDDVRAVWLTPILTDTSVAESLRCASDDHLAIGGTADPAWRPERVSGTRADLVSVEGADHGLELPGFPWRSSVDAQTSVLDRLTAHLRL